MTVSNCNDGDPTGGMDLNEVQAAIEASTLGTRHARAMRAEVTSEVAENAVARLRARLTAKGLPGGAPVPHGEGNPDGGPLLGSTSSQDSTTANGDLGAAGIPVEHPAEEITSESVAPDPVSPATSSRNRFGPSELAPLVTEFFARPDEVILVDPRREEVLIDIATYIDEITGQDASTIDEDTLLHEELGLDSLDAQQMVLLIEENYDIDIPPVHFHQMHTVADIITAILAIFDAQTNQWSSGHIEQPAPTCELKSCEVKNGRTPVSLWRNLLQ